MLCYLGSFNYTPNATSKPENAGQLINQLNSHLSWLGVTFAQAGLIEKDRVDVLFCIDEQSGSSITQEFLQRNLNFTAGLPANKVHAPSNRFHGVTLNVMGLL